MSRYIQKRATGGKSDCCWSALEKGDVAAFGQLLVVAMEFIEAGKPPPVALKLFVIKILRDRLLRKSKLANRDRDIHISSAIQHLVENGFRPTRNVASRGGDIESACSIVSAALGRMGKALSEDALEKIWQRSDALLGAFKPKPITITKRGSLEEWRGRQYEDYLLTFMETQREVILAELGRHPDAEGQWCDDDIAALRVECPKRFPPTAYRHENF